MIDISHPANLLPWIALILWFLIAGMHAGAMLLSYLHTMRQKNAIDPARYQRRMTCLLPFSRSDTFFDEGIKSLANQDYKNFKIMICSDQADAARIASIQELTPEMSSVPVVFAKDHLLRNPKINNLLPAVVEAKGELLLIKDANIILEKGDLSNMERDLEDDVGLVCSLPVARKPKSLAAWFELTIMNGRDAPFTSAASLLGVTVGYGKIMLFRKRDLDRIGGFASLGDVFGDDHALALAMERIGLKTIYTAHTVSQPLGSRTWSDVINRQIRWMMIRRDQEPLAFFGEPLMTSPLHILLATLTCPLSGLSIWESILLAVIIRHGIEGFVLTKLEWSSGLRYLPLSLLRDTVLWLIWPRVLLAKDLRWGERIYRAVDE